jgi:type I restriction enzyme, R subunit
MNEPNTETRLIEPKLKESGWDSSKFSKQYPIAPGKIEGHGQKQMPLKADYILKHRGRKLAVIEAKRSGLGYSEGAMQAKNYAKKLKLETAFATNGKKIYQICLKTGKEGLIDSYPTPEELWNKSFSKHDEWKEKFDAVPKGSRFEHRFYQEIAINKTLDAIAEDKKKLLLTLATGSGKTVIAFEIAWKLFNAKWNLKKDGKRRPRILFLTDRNILADQALTAFSSFSEGALKRIRPSEIKKKGRVPMNASIFFTIFQTFMSGKNNKSYFGQYPKDFFDLIIIDECHRGGANDEGSWRKIMEYFSPAVQLGLTATPKRKENADTYKYFGNPIYEYSMKEGTDDGFLTPFRLRKHRTSIDEYTYTTDDKIVEGELEGGKIHYEEKNFNKTIEIDAREEKRVKIFLSEINQNEKSLVFCATQRHALEVRNLINQNTKSKELDYCVRVTANDGKEGEKYLREFRDNEKTIPTILTTSQKLSTGVDAKNIRHIVLMRPINSMIEFKQIIGRGTRTFDNKKFFTIHDFVGAHRKFKDPDWDGAPAEPIITGKSKKFVESKKRKKSKDEDKKLLKIKLGDGKIRELEHFSSTLYYFEGKPISLKELIEKLYGVLPKFFKSEKQLREIWRVPSTRKKLLDNLSSAGFSISDLKIAQKLINAEHSDLFDVLNYIKFAIKPISRNERVAKSENKILKNFKNEQKEFINFVLSKYIESGVEELEQENLSELIKLKYGTNRDAINIFGNVKMIKDTFFNFQKHLY